MARQPRLDFPGAFHHVMNRGAALQDTYQNTFDRELFLELWEQATSKFGIEVITFSLMSNHYHVFVHSPDGQLSATMQYVGRAYTQIYNSRHGRDGALFRGRFHSVLIESETHLARVARYVELNPVAAGLCPIDELDSYPWSSFRYSSGTVRSPDWLSLKHLQSRFSSPSEYRKFVESGTPDSELQRSYDRLQKISPVLGSEAFITKIANEHPNMADQIRANIVRPSPTPEQIESLILQFCGVARDAIFSYSRPIHPARRAAFLLSHALCGLPRQELATRYGFGADTTFLAAVRDARTQSGQDGTAWLCEAVMGALDLENSPRI